MKAAWPWRGRGGLVLLFPGQGSQHVGMAGDLARLPAARDVLDEAEAAAGLPLRRLMAEGPEV